MNWKKIVVYWCVLLLAACSAGLEVTPDPTASPQPTATVAPQQSGLQVVMFYSPL